MDSPILPDDDGDGADARRRRYLTWGAALRAVAGLLAVVAALIGLANRIHASQTPAPVNDPAIRGYDGRLVIYGDLTSPQALKPGKANDPARVVCDDEVRFKPTTGHWHCVGTASLGDKDVGRVARDPGGSCTHRTAGMDTPTWTCITKEPVPPSALGVKPAVPGERNVIFGGMRDGSDFCSEEARDNATHGAWTCTWWRPVPPGYRFIEAVAGPGPCTFRAADQQTGEWSCDPPLPGL